MAVYVSWDGGKVWETTWTSETAVSDPRHPLFSCLLLGDAVASFLPDGGLLIGGMAGTTVGTLSLFVMRSDDGGRTFPHHVWVDGATPAASCGGDPFPAGNRQTESTDKPDLDVAADGTAVMSWHRLGVQVGGGVDTPRPNGFVLSFSEDGGWTWGEPIPVPDSVWGLGYSMDLLNGTILELASQQSSKIIFLATPDGGKTWSNSTVGPTSNQYPSYVRAGDHRVTAFALYGDGEYTPTLATSIDGLTWDYIALAPPSEQLPMMSADADGSGTVYVSYWTTRGMSGEAIAREAVAWRNGVLSEPVRLDSLQQPERHDMSPLGYGHYQALGAFPGGAFVAWGAGRPQLADLHAARIIVSP
ncbi:MAG: sialidase family protein [Thermoplasmatota archaeon]